MSEFCNFWFILYDEIITNSKLLSITHAKNSNATIFISSSYYFVSIPTTVYLRCFTMYVNKLYFYSYNFILIWLNN